jgi:hypothetical protein
MAALQSISLLKMYEIFALIFKAVNIAQRKTNEESLFSFWIGSSNSLHKIINNIEYYGILNCCRGKGKGVPMLNYLRMEEWMHRAKFS